MTRSSKRLAVLGAVGAVVLVAIIAFATTRSSDSSSASSPESTTPSNEVTTSTAPVDTGPTATDSTVDPNAPAVVTTTTQPPDLELDVQVSSTTNLTDGQAVKIHVTPTGGSDIYAAEAFLCAPGVTYTLDADIRPSITGKCVAQRLSPNSLDYLKQVVGPPYQVLDLSFPVGVGSDHYTTQQGKEVTITCGPGHPCTLVLKLQIPNGYGFKTYPLTFR